MRVRHVARNTGTGLWQAFTIREDGLQACFYARKREQAVEAAYSFIGREPLDADLSAALDEALEARRGE